MNLIFLKKIRWAVFKTVADNAAYWITANFLFVLSVTNLQDFRSLEYYDIFQAEIELDIFQSFNIAFALFTSSIFLFIFSVIANYITSDQYGI